MTIKLNAELDAKLEQLEKNPDTNWEDYGDIGRFCNYKWDDKKGKWESYNILIISMVLSTLVASDDAKAPFLEFLDKVMGKCPHCNDWMCGCDDE